MFGVHQTGRTAEEKSIQKFIAFVRAGIYSNTAAVKSKALHNVLQELDARTRDIHAYAGTVHRRN